MSTFFVGSPVQSQSSLGIIGGAFDLVSTEGEDGTARASLSSSVDVRITQVHGLQGDLSFSESVTGTIGRLNAHLYMVPKPGQKYGVFMSLSDLDGRSMAWGTVGAEAMLSLGRDTVVEGRIGLDAADSGSLDYIFGGVSFTHAATPSLELEAALDVADFDEAAFRATAIDASLTASYSPQGKPWGLYASVIQSELTGRDGGKGSTRIAVGMTFEFGATGGSDPHTRLFRDVDPVAPLIRRGLW